MDDGRDIGSSSFSSATGVGSIRPRRGTIRLNRS